MRNLLIILSLLMLAIPAMAEDQYTHGYYRSNGTYVQGYHHSAPDGNPYNNYSTQGNTNPYTGQAGTVNPYSYNSGYSNSSYGSYGNNNNSTGWYPH